MVDYQIMAIHPHMAKIIAFYEMLINRYYSPVWKKNAEGRLQVPEEEGEEEKDEGDDDDDDDNGKENKEKHKLDTGRLERGEGVEIVVLKVVSKKKKKKKKKRRRKKMMGLKMKKRIKK